MNLKEEHPIDESLGTIKCYRMRTQDADWRKLIGLVSEPFARGRKVLRVFYPDDETEAPFYVSSEMYDYRRGNVWERLYYGDFSKSLRILLEHKRHERETMQKYLDMLTKQIANLSIDLGEEV